MTDNRADVPAVDRFILDFIDSVPHLEALLLLWRSRPRRWTVEELAKYLYLGQRESERIAQDLARAGLIAGSGAEYHYLPDSDAKDRLVSSVDETYRREVVRISTLIHSNGSRALRDFARSFRFTKGKD